MAFCLATISVAGNLIKKSSFLYMEPAQDFVVSGTASEPVYGACGPYINQTWFVYLLEICVTS